MKNKGLIWGAIASLFSLLLILPLCLGAWIGYAGSETLGDPIGMFADWSTEETLFSGMKKTFPTFWANFVGILAIIALVAGVLFILLYVLDLTKVTKPGKTDLLKKILGAVMIICAVAAVVAILVFNGNAKYTTVLTNTVTGYKALFSPWLIPIFAALGGATAILSACGKKTSKKRK